MFRAYIEKNRGIPWWAYLGAPALGVPAVVALLALVGPSEQAQEPVDDVDFAVERLEVDTMGMPESQALDLRKRISLG